MAYDYGSARIEVTNPFRLAGLLATVRGLAVTGMGVVLLFALRRQTFEAGSAVGVIKLLGAIALTSAGLASLGGGLLRIFRFYVGRSMPADLAKTPGTSRHRIAYGIKDLREIMVRRVNPTFAEPNGWLSRLLHSFEENLMFVPTPLRNVAQTLFETAVLTLVAGILFGLAAFSATLGVVPMGGTPVLRWLGWLLVVALAAIWWRLRPSMGRVVRTSLRRWSPRTLAALIAIAVLGPALLIGVHRGNALPDIPASPVPWILLLGLGGSAICASGILMAFLRMPPESPRTEVSEFRDQWQESIHPMDLFRAFDTAMADFRFKEVPNRVYEQHNPALVDESKGTFSGSMMQETQPIPTEMTVPPTLAKLRMVNLIVGNALLLAAAGGAFALLGQLPGLASAATVNWAVGTLIIGLFGLTLTQSAIAFYSEIQFDSRLLYFYTENGTFTRSKLSTGMAIYDSTRSENEVVRSSMTPWLLCTRLTTSTFAVSGAQNLEQERYVLEMQRDDGFLHAMVRTLQDFLRARQLVAGFTSPNDFGATGTINQMNQMSRGPADRSPSLPAEPRPASLPAAEEPPPPA